MQKSVAFLHTLLSTIRKRKKANNLFKIELKIIRYLEINLTKEVKDLYSENSKTLMKEIEDNTNKLEGYLFL